MFMVDSFLLLTVCLTLPVWHVDAGRREESIPLISEA
jgi:hypothetical protein